MIYIRNKKSIRKLFLLLIVTIFITGLFSGCKKIVTDDQLYIEEETSLEVWELSGNDFIAVAENDNLILMIKPKTTEVAIYDKASSKTWYSNPQDRLSDSIARGANATWLSSQFTVEFSNKVNRSRIVDNFSFSVENDQFKFYQLPNGIRIDYLLQPIIAVEYMPEAVTQEDFEDIILPAFAANGSDQARVRQSYRKIVYSEIDGTLRAELDSKYAFASDYEVFYILYGSITNIARSRLNSVFQSYGFTVEEKDAFEEKMGLIESEALFYVNLSIEYSLDDNSLVVNVPAEKINSSQDIKVTDITLLDLFGAGHMQDDGYLFIPDGSGAIIEFDQNRLFRGPLWLNYYGEDKAIHKLAEHMQPRSLHLPVYGIVADDKALFAVIESGDAMAGLSINMAGRISEYNTLTPTFKIKPNSVINLQAIAGGNTVKVYQSKPYTGNISIRYMFLSNEDASYSGMARIYREYLKNYGVLTKNESKSQIPFMFEVVGAIDKTITRLGFPVNKELALTSFDEVRLISEELMSYGIDDQVIRLTGWSRGGISNYLQNKVAPERVLGGMKEFIDLMNYMDKAYVDIYPDFNASYLAKTRNSIFNSFSPFNNGVRNLRRQVASVFRYRINTGMIKSTYDYNYIFSPEYKRKIADQYYNSISNNNFINSVSFAQTGSDLSSDFNNRNQYDRQQMQENEKAVMEMFSDDNKVMFTEANAYALEFADFIDNVPASSSMYDIYDKDIPFYQMVIHSYIPYSIDKLNLSGYSDDYIILKLIETNSAPSYRWIYREDSIIKNSEYNDNFSLNYLNWIEDAVQIYNELNKVIGRLNSVEIIEHIFLDNDIVRLTYADGTKIYINYSNEMQTPDGISIMPMNYAVIEQSY